MNMNSEKDTPPEVFIDFHDEDERALFTEARLGQEALDFLSTPLGQLLQGRAQGDLEEAKDILIDLDPEDDSTIRKWQMKAQMAQQFLRWIGEAIQNGYHAEQQLETYSEETD